MKRWTNIVLSASLIGTFLSPVGNTFASESKINPEELIIFFEDEEAMNNSAISNSVVEVSKTYEKLPAMVVEANPENIAKISSLPGVETVELNQPVHLNVEMDSIKKLGTQISPSASTTWGLDHVKAKTAWASGINGTGVKIAVADTGIDMSHGDLQYAGGKSFVTDTKPDGSEDLSIQDYHGHGTHVSGIINAKNNGAGITGVAPNASLYVLKVFNKNGEGTTSEVLSAIDWSLANDMDILNLSLGSQSGFESYQQAVEEAYRQGLLIVAAAGNDFDEPTAVGGCNFDPNANCVDFPAAYDSTIAVAAIDEFNSHGTFSSAGPSVEVSAPGVSIVSTYLNGAFAQMSGTSMAAPYAAGVLALYKQKNPDATPVELRKLLIDTAVDTGAAGKDMLFGYGYIQTDLSEGITEPNRAPIVTLPIPDKTLEKRDDWYSIDLSQHFADADGDELLYSIVNEDGISVYTQIGNGDLIISALSEGSTDLRVQASDGELSVYDDFTVTVTGTNQPPKIVKNLEDVTIKEQEVLNIDLSAYFADDDKDVITFEAITSNGLNFVETSVNQKTLSLFGVSEGNSEVTVTASDGKVTVSETFDVIVERDEPVVEIEITPFKKIIYLTEKTYFYHEPDTKNGAVWYLNPQKLTAINKYGDEWVEVMTWLGPKWLKTTKYVEGVPDIVSKKIRINQTTFLHDSPSEVTKRTNSIGVQTVYSKMELNGWYLIGTWIGDKWIKPINHEVQPYVEILTLKESTPLYTTNNEKYKVGASLGTQSVYAYEKRGDWYLINTWLGKRWIKPTSFSAQKPDKINGYLDLKVRVSLYDSPYVPYYGTVAPQKIYVYEKLGNWYYISTWLGKKWVNIP